MKPPKTLLAVFFLEEWVNVRNVQYFLCGKKVFGFAFARAGGGGRGGYRDLHKVCVVGACYSCCLPASLQCSLVTFFQSSFCHHSFWGESEELERELAQSENKIKL